MDPALRQNIAHRVSDRLEAFASPDRAHVHDVIEDEMPLVKRLVSSSEANGSAAILLNELGQFRFRQSGKAGAFLVLCFHCLILSNLLFRCLLSPAKIASAGEYVMLNVAALS